jgi:hypothetical protein
MITAAGLDTSLSILSEPQSRQVIFIFLSLASDRSSKVAPHFAQRYSYMGIETSQSLTVF